MRKLSVATKRIRIARLEGGVMSIKDLLWEILLLGVPLVFLLGGYMAAPVLLIWSWTRWARRSKQWGTSAILSLTGLVLATASALVAIYAIAYSSSLGGDFMKHFDNPVFMETYQRGLWLARIGIAVGICGLWKPSALRWQGLACAVGTWMFWTLVAGDVFI
jgi:hypothetical protein